jgi:uncharacterized protein (DUF2384 family)
MATQSVLHGAAAGESLSRATAKVADFWSLTNDQLGTILGVSAATASRLRDGRYVLDPRSKSFELAQYLLRLFRSLDAMMGSDDQASRAWLRAPNLDLERSPIELLGTFTGLARVCDYVDGFRARV